MTKSNAKTLGIRRVQIGAVLLAAGMTAAACGSSSSGGTPAASQSHPAVVPSATPTVAAATSAAPLPASGGGSNSGSSFCQLAKAAQAQSIKEEQAFETDSPAQLGAYIQHALSEIEAFASSAPSAIRNDVKVALSADQTIFAALKKANYNYKNIPPTALQSVDTPAFTKASTAIAAYLASSCGITPSTVPTG